MKKYIFKRILMFIPVFFGITILSFGLMYLAPSDPVEMYYISRNQPIPSETELKEKRKELGLDKPLVVQYGSWLGRFLKGDMGNSYDDREPVAQKIYKALPYTLELTFTSVLLTILISTPLGIISAARKDGIIDTVIRYITFTVSSIPGFLLSIFLMYIFGVSLKILPVISLNSKGGIILPTLVLALSMSSKYIRQVRAAVLDELNKEYILGARSRGLKENIILYKNVLRNTMVTIITLIGLSIGSLLGGAAIIENIFVWPGMGKLVIDAIGSRDYPTVQAFVVWMSLIFVVINILTDISYLLLDPRIRMDGDN